MLRSNFIVDFDVMGIGFDEISRLYKLPSPKDKG